MHTLDEPRLKDKDINIGTILDASDLPPALYLDINIIVSLPLTSFCFFTDLL